MSLIGNTATGASLGTAIVPGIGTAIGAVAGAVASLFGPGTNDYNNRVSQLSAWMDADGLIVTDINQQAVSTILQMPSGWQDSLLNYLGSVRDTKYRYLASVGQLNNNPFIQSLINGAVVAGGNAQNTAAWLQNLIPYEATVVNPNSGLTETPILYAGQSITTITPGTTSILGTPINAGNSTTTVLQNPNGNTSNAGVSNTQVSAGAQMLANANASIANTVGIPATNYTPLYLAIGAVILLLIIKK
jgi:hypothetical protein